MKMLVVNVGSTSLKFRLFDLDKGEVELASGRIEGIGAADKKHPYSMKAASGKTLDAEAAWPDYAAALDAALKFLTTGDGAPLASLGELGGVGFKCVHGGAKFTGAHVLTEEVLQAMEEANPLAPAHNPPYLLAIRSIARAMPELPLAALFEPDFHTTIPDAAALYGVPYEWKEKYGIRKLGFHGASHRYISERVPKLIGRGPADLKVISCHLGGSSSITAIADGKSVEHSMGFSPQSGLIHGTRIGDLDPFVALYLMEKEGWSAAEIGRILTKESGLKGVSGVGSEYRDVEAAAKQGNSRANLACDMFIRGVRHYIGAFVAAMGGVDVLALTGGIGERSVTAREQICANLECMGIKLDPAKNNASPTEGPIHALDSKAEIWVVPTNEEIIVARAAARAIAESL